MAGRRSLFSHANFDIFLCVCLSSSTYDLTSLWWCLWNVNKACWNFITAQQLAPGISETNNIQLHSGPDGCISHLAKGSIRLTSSGDIPTTHGRKGLVYSTRGISSGLLYLSQLTQSNCWKALDIDNGDGELTWEVDGGEMLNNEVHHSVSTKPLPLTILKILWQQVAMSLRWIPDLIEGLNFQFTRIRKQKLKQTGQNIYFDFSLMYLSVQWMLIEYQLWARHEGTVPWSNCFRIFSGFIPSTLPSSIHQAQEKLPDPCFLSMRSYKESTRFSSGFWIEWDSVLALLITTSLDSWGWFS